MAAPIVEPERVASIGEDPAKFKGARCRDLILLGRLDRASSTDLAVHCETSIDLHGNALVLGNCDWQVREIAPVLRQFQQSQAATWRPGLAILHCELGSRDEARAEFEELAVNDFAGITHDAVRTPSLAYLAEVCVWLGDIRHAATLFDLLLPYAERNIVLGAQTASLGSGARLLGMLAATLQRWDVAQHHFDVRTGGRPWLAHSRCDFGAMLLQRGRSGDHERGLGFLESALGEASALGMRALTERVLARQARAASGRTPKVRLAGLSEREIQVLQLVAAGRTNQEIATILCRSPNTVAVHVRSILGKTQAANRAEAAAFAARHGLLPTA